MMSQENWDSLNIIILLFAITASIIGLIAEMRGQRQGREDEQSEEATKEEIRKLRNELNLLKIQLEEMKK